MNKKSKNALLLVVIIAIIGIAVGYAALSQQLVLNGTATVQGASDWDVKFSDTTKAVASEAGASDVKLTLDNGKLSGTFTATFAPGGYADYEVTVINGGTIPARFDGVAVTGPTGTPYTTCVVTEPDTTPDLVDDVAGHTFKIHLACKDMNSLPDTTVTEEYTVTFDYVQVTNPQN